jgi:hypothetical protein
MRDDEKVKECSGNAVLQASEQDGGEGDAIVWFWIGLHSEYDSLL